MVVLRLINTLRTMTTPPEATNCEKCGKAIAAMPAGDALCCRCRYGQMVEREEPREPDALEMMRRHDAVWLAAGGEFGLHQ